MRKIPHLGGGLAGHFPHLKKTNVFKMHLSHFKPIKTMFFHLIFLKKKLKLFTLSSIGGGGADPSVEFSILFFWTGYLTGHLS